MQVVLKNAKDWWLVDVRVSSDNLIRLVIHTDQPFFALSFSYGFSYKQVRIVTGDKARQHLARQGQWMIPETLTNAIFYVRTHHKDQKFMWTDFFNDSQIEA